MTIPPLHEGILHTTEDRVGMRPGSRDLEVIHHIEHGDGDNGGDVEPEGNVEGLLVTFSEGPEEVVAENEPRNSDQEVDRPDQLGIFFPLSKAERDGDGSCYDDGLPSPEMKPCERIRGDAAATEALGGVIDTSKHHVPYEGEDGGISMHGADAAKGDIRDTFGFECPAG